MPEIRVDMSKVDQEVAHEVANDILLFFADIHDEGVSILDMIVSLGIVMEIMIEQNAGQVAHTRSH
jgi:metal-sulfur cluster biosynthetic enzyme